MTAGQLQLLLVEDNPGDVDLTREALAESSVPAALNVVGDGVEALDFLRRKGKYAGAPRPALILLDLNLPRKDGREVLAEVKQDPELMEIPVVVLTTSQADQDVRACYRLHANCYIAKPVELHQFLAALRSFEEFWFKHVKLSPHEEPRRIRDANRKEPYPRITGGGQPR